MGVVKVGLLWLAKTEVFCQRIIVTKKASMKDNTSSNFDNPYCNAGKATVTKKGDLKGYGTVWYYPEGIFLSLHKVQEKYKVMYDSSTMAGFVVHRSDGTNRIFKPSKKGLFFSDVKRVNEHILVHTVDSIKNKYTVKEYSDARKAQTIQDIIG